MSTSPRYVVVGGGCAGLSAAILLAQSQPHAEVELWEGSSQIGGLLAPVPFCGIPCDRGSHRIHPQADPLLLALTKAQEWQERPRRGTLILNQRHIHYPPQPLRFLQGLGLRTSFEMGLGFAMRPQSLRRFLSWEQDRADVHESDDEGFEQFVVARVGHAAYRQFYRPYVEKVWGMAPAKISRTVAKQRVSTSNPWNTLLGMLRGGKERRTHQHFLYPRYGMNGLIEELLSAATAEGVTIHCARKVTRDSLAQIDASAILFSGHLSHLAPDCGLTHRGLYLLHLAFPRGSVGDTDTFYTPEARYWFGRVSQLEQFSPSLQVADKQILCVEIPEGRWGPDRAFTDELDTLQRQLASAGIIAEDAPILESQQTFVPRVYPMYTRGWFARWQEALQQLKALERVMPIGRQGLFLHCNVDHCVRIAGDATRHLSAGHSPTQWIDQAHRYLDLRVRD